MKQNFRPRVGQAMYLPLLSLSLVFASCTENSQSENTQESTSARPTAETPVVQTDLDSESHSAQPTVLAGKETATTAPANTYSPAAGKTADAATILNRKEVPILCYHRIRPWKANDSKSAKDYIVEVQNFKDQIKMLADSGYQTILPDQLFAYLNTGAPIPEKAVMLTFDDNVDNQFLVAAPELAKYGFKAVFFIMTVTLGKPGYMSKDQLKQLQAAGHVIASHTYDHHNVKKYAGQDWETQIEKPKKVLEDITEQPVHYFAYPFGLWNPEAIPELKSRGFQGAFILATKRDEQDPLFTIRRIIASGHWSPRSLHRSMVNSFH